MGDSELCSYVAFQNDGFFLGCEIHLVSSDDGALFIDYRHSQSEGRAVWNLLKQTETPIVVGDSELCSYVAFQNDGFFLGCKIHLISSDDGASFIDYRHSKSEGRTVWNLLKHAETPIVVGDSELCSYVAFQNDGFFLGCEIHLVSSDDGALFIDYSHSKSEGRTVWNLLKHAETPIVVGDSELCSYVAFQNDGFFLGWEIHLVSSDDGALFIDYRHSKSEGRTVWNLLKHAETAIVVGDSELRSYVAFQNDGFFLGCEIHLVSSDDGALFIDYRHSKSEGRAVWNLLKHAETPIVVGDSEPRSYVAFQNDRLFLHIKKGFHTLVN